MGEDVKVEIKIGYYRRHIIGEFFSLLNFGLFLHPSPPIFSASSLRNIFMWYRLAIAWYGKGLP